MVNALMTKILIGCFVLSASGGAAILIYQDKAASIGPASAAMAIEKPAAVHSSVWYTGHPKVLKQDEGRCAGDATTISQSACQNVDSADNQLGIIEMENAASQKNSSGKSSNQ